MIRHRSVLIGRALACVSLGLALLPTANASPASTDWSEYLGGPERNHHSPLAQIDASNVTRLQVAWEHHTGEPGQMQCNPLVRDGMLYAVSATGRPFALDARTGALRWRFAGEMAATARTLRGVAFWTDGNERRILFTIDDQLHSVDAATGEPVAGFGHGGKISLKTGLGTAAQAKWVGCTTPGTIFENLIIMPTRVAESPGAAPGSIQAFDVRTGKLVWIFHTIPLPGEIGHDTWPAGAHASAIVGGANSWPGMAVDRTRGLLFVPTGSASPDFWGGARLGRNLFANCLLALDARTGKRRWHFQFVHHDLWDRDLPAPPNLVTVHREGKRTDAVAQITKDGYVFVFDRETGTPLFPVEEVPVPPSELPGEDAWPTQPRPVQPAPFARQELVAGDLNPFAENHATLLAEFQAARRGAFQPFGLSTTILFPGFDGGGEWGGAAADPDGVLYINANEIAWLASLSPTPRADKLSHLTPGHRAYLASCVACHGAERQGNPMSGFPALTNLGPRRTRDEIDHLLTTGKGMMPGFPGLSAAVRQQLGDFLLGEEKQEGPSAGAAPDATVPYQFDGYRKFLDNRGYPAIRPPWGTLTAIDLNTGKHRWQVPLGEYPELKARGIPPTGIENYGGPLITAGGLLFIAATKDGNFRAFDRRTGRLLWEVALPASGFATPATYAVDGRQYVVVACGGTKLGTPSGDSYIAFSLPP